MTQNLIIWLPFDYILLFILGFLPLVYKILFWLYTIQLKEYRWDRFKEYLRTKQAKSAIINIFSVLDLILLIIAVLIWFLYIFKNLYYIPAWWIMYQIFFRYLLILNLFVLGKIFRKRILKPKFTFRVIILIFLFIIWWSIDLYFFFKWNLWNYTYLYILLVYLFLPIILFFYNFISLPIVNYKKNKIINAAIKKSNEINNPPIKIAITWSYWKSSVKEFLASILEQIPLSQSFLQGEKEVKNVLKTPENINTELWVSALILNKLNDKFKYFVAEIWAYRRWEIKTLWKIVNHKYGFLTAIWNQHIGLFGSQENIIKWKFEILEKVQENNGFLYVNVDNKYIKDYLEKINTTNIIRYWINSDKACAKSKILEIKNLNTKFEFSYNWIKEIFETNLIWEHNILNLTWILAFCYDIWLKTEDLKKYLLNIKKPKNTQEIIPLSKFFPQGEKDLKVENIAIDDTYNLSEAGLKSGLSLLKYFKDKEKILVLDDILELGEQAEEIHYNIAKEIAKNNLVDKVLFAWINYEENFKKGLVDWWFKKENILNDLEKISENSVILFEGKKAKNYLNKLNK